MEENNKIIAEFMGLKKETKTTFYNPKDCPNAEPFEVLYHSDWNELMEVVEKIEREFCSTNIHYYSQKQMYSVEFLGYNIEYNNSEYGDDKMKILYDSCIKFINFYNKQKEK